MPTDARADSAGSKADTLASNDAESTARSGEPTTNVGMAGSLRATPQMFLIIALGLAVVGILSRIVMTIAAARRARVVFNHPESDRVDWESELTFVFGRRCRRVREADAADVEIGRAHV